MGSSYKKRQRAEKAKIKLKSKKLPKGLNITKTEFKVRKIIIKEQLKQSTIVEGQRLYDLKELNSKLKHYNHNCRQEALHKVREAILLNHAKLPIHLNDLIQSICSLSLDEERSIRRESFRVLSSLLENLTPERTAPFFHILSSYLRCAMTHIHTSIQEDALLMLDILLRHVPELVAADSSRILQNFLEMISRVRNDGKITGTKINNLVSETAATSASGRRLLTVPVGQKQTVIKWRARVLVRLQEMLCTLVSYKRQQMQSTREQLRTAKTFVFCENKPQYISLLRPCIEMNAITFGENICNSYYNNINKTTNNELTTCTENVTDGLNYSTGNSRTELCSYIESLMPLLVECWMEVKPKANNRDHYQQSIFSQKKSNLNLTEGVLPLNSDGVNTLNLVLEVIEHLWSLIDLYEGLQFSETKKELTIWFQDMYQETFANNFMQSTMYPYRMCGKVINTETTDNFDGSASKRTKQRNDKAMQSVSNCLHENISVSYLMCRFYATTEYTDTYDNDTNHRFTRIIRCLQKIVVDSTKVVYHSQSLQQSLIQTLRVLLLEKGKYFLQQLPDETILLLQNLLKVLLQTNSTEDEDQSKQQSTIFNNKIATLLCEIILNTNLYEMYGGHEEFQNFLQFLPSLLLQNTIHNTTIETLTQLGKQQQPIFLKSFSENIQSILKHLQFLQIIGSKNIIESKKSIINLIFWLRLLESESGDNIKDAGNNIYEEHMKENKKIRDISVKETLNCNEILQTCTFLTDECLLDYLKHVLTITI